jgi:hypothetical protein
VLLTDFPIMHFHMRLRAIGSILRAYIVNHAHDEVDLYRDLWVSIDQSFVYGCLSAKAHHYPLAFFQLMSALVHALHKSIMERLSQWFGGYGSTAA